MRLPLSHLTEFCTAALLKCGLSPDHATQTADALVLTDSWGIHTHGTKNLRGYIRRLIGGGIRADAQPSISSEGPAWALVDGQNAIGMVASTFAMNAAIAKARDSGIAFVGLRGSCHFGAAGVYSNLAAQAGMIGISMTNDTPTVAVPGSRSAVLGSNPLSYAIPVKGGNPILLDIATSTVAGGKVFQAAARHEPIPPGWIIDENGQPTVDAKLFPDRATLTSFSAHKGYGIALLIEVLSAVISGAAIASGVPSWSFSDASIHTNHGGAFIALDITKLLSRDQFDTRLAGMLQEIRSAPRAPGVERIFLPGELEWERRETALHQGLELPPETSHNLELLAAELGLKL